MRKSVFGGKGGGCEAPVFNHLFWKIYTSTFNFLHLVYVLEFNFIFERNAKKMFGKIGNQSNSAAVNCLKLQDQLLTDRTTWNPGIYQKEESPVCWSPGFCVKRYRHKESSGYVRILRRHNILDFESRALTIRPSSSLSPIFFWIVLLVHFFTFRFWDDWA